MPPTHRCIDQMSHGPRVEIHLGKAWGTLFCVYVSSSLRYPRYLMFGSRWGLRWSWTVVVVLRESDERRGRGTTADEDFAGIRLVFVEDVVAAVDVGWRRRGRIRK